MSGLMRCMRRRRGRKRRMGEILAGVTATHPSAKNAERVGHPLCILLVLVMGSWLRQRVCSGLQLDARDGSDRCLKTSFTVDSSRPTLPQSARKGWGTLCVFGRICDGVVVTRRGRSRLHFEVRGRGRPRHTYTADYYFSRVSKKTLHVPN